MKKKHKFEIAFHMGNFIYNLKKYKSQNFVETPSALGTLKKIKLIK